ncbi:Amine oxidase [Trema orientale]|uniref:Amine oxidase n=1 Tax=Trema orientale TaxID=63057 RepID=A0A2P5FZI3_TREOI|nr:Amine oxidase [Trema orientale]
MHNTTIRVAVLGTGRAVSASILARNGVSVTLFESARGPGGRMSQRREVSDDGKELLFDHGAPFFTASNTEVLGLVQEWEARGLVAEWKENFGSFDCTSSKFIDIEQDQVSKRYVGVPGMNSICKALCREPGVEAKFGTSVGKLEWLQNEDLWMLTGLDGQNLGQFNGVVASDKNIVSPRFTSVTGRPPPLDLKLVPEMAEKLQDIPVHPCFALMLAFVEPLSSIPYKGFSIKNSEVLSWAHCDSSKPGRSATSERWILHSTEEYAQSIISQTGLQKPSDAILRRVSEELLQAFQSTGINTSQLFYKKAHRWGSAFPATSIAREEKCLWDKKKRLAICGDFCVSPNVEGAIISGMAAASKLKEIVLSCL